MPKLKYTEQPAIMTAWADLIKAVGVFDDNPRLVLVASLKLMDAVTNYAKQQGKNVGGPDFAEAIRLLQGYTALQIGNNKEKLIKFVTKITEFNSRYIFAGMEQQAPILYQALRSQESVQKYALLRHFVFTLHSPLFHYLVQAGVIADATHDNNYDDIIAVINAFKEAGDKNPKLFDLEEMQVRQNFWDKLLQKEYVRVIKNKIEEFISLSKITEQTGENTDPKEHLDSRILNEQISYRSKYWRLHNEIWSDPLVGKCFKKHSGLKNNLIASYERLESTHIIIKSNSKAFNAFCAARIAFRLIEKTENKWLQSDENLTALGKAKQELQAKITKETKGQSLSGTDVQDIKKSIENLQSNYQHRFFNPIRCCMPGENKTETEQDLDDILTKTGLNTMGSAQ